MIQLTQREYDALVAAGAEAERLKSILAEVHAWVIRAPFSLRSIKDAQDARRVVKITSPDYTGKGATE